ncbi:MAG: alpha/beta hydrolase [Tepidisphaerales bacterium]
MRISGWRRLAVVGVAVVLAWLIVSAVVAWKLTGRPRPWFAEPAPVWEGIAVEDCRLKTSDGQEIGAWFLPTDEHRTGVVVVHGLGGSRSGSTEKIQRIRLLGYSVLAISARAHGDSSGDRNDAGYSSRRDVHAAVEFLRQKRPGRPVVVLGASLGSVAAIFDASDSRGAVQGYFLEAPYRDLNTAVWNRVEMRLPTPLSHIGYAGLRLWTPVFVSDAAAIRPVERIADIPENVPVVIVASEADRHARIEEARELYSRIQSHGRLVVVPDAPHCGVFGRYPERYMQALARLLEEVETRTHQVPTPPLPPP